MNQIKYYLGALLMIPMLPLMYVQGKRIRSSVPKLPEAKNPEGKAGEQYKRKLRLLSIGESTIAGVGVDTHEEGFTGTLAKELSNLLQREIYWKVYARSGYTAKKLKEKIIPKIRETEIDAIVIGLGGNDAFTLNNPKTWKKHIRELIGSIRNKFGDVPVFFTNMPPIKSFPAFTPLIKLSIGNLVELLGKELEDLSQTEKNVFYSARKITLQDWIKRLNIEARPEDFFSDGVHPSKLTYQTWARDFAEFINSQNKLVEHKP